MKKCFVVMCCIFAFIMSFGMIFMQDSNKSLAISDSSARVIVSKCYLYTADNFTSEKVSYIEDENTVLVILKHGDVVDIQSESGDFAYVTTATSVQGYVYKYYLSKNSSQAVYPVFNASIRKDTKIYDIDLKETDYFAKAKTRVYIYEGFDDKKEYTAVQIVLEDESLYNGYVLTSDVSPDGVSGLLIIAISIIIAAVTIILSIVFMKKKKKPSKLDK